MAYVRFLAKDTRFDVVTGKEGEKSRRKRQRAKSEKEIYYLDGMPYKRIPLGPGKKWFVRYLILNSAQASQLFCRISGANFDIEIQYSCRFESS